MYPLTLTKDGERVEVQSLNCQHDDVYRLNEMGCVQGAKGTIISNQDNVILQVGETRLAIAGNLAKSIFVTSLN
ncbi:MAG: FeoA domain-containing protein [Balneolales bacterium]|nr:FeoA domain-containing protein [Balneolales bacterium]